MPTATTTRKRLNGKRSVPENALYAPIGAGQLLVEKTREASKRAWAFAQKRRTKMRSSYEDLARRGEKLVSSVRRSTGAATKKPA
jgi:hypothetical protein